MTLLTSVVRRGNPTRTTRRRLPAAIVVASWAIIIAILVCSFIGAHLAPHSASAQNLLESAKGPSSAHPLGTDVLGRDILSRLLVGSRSMVVGPALAALGTFFFATFLGLASAYAGGRIEAIIMRGLDMLHALPSILVAIIVVGSLGGGYYLAVTCIIVLAIPSGARLIRAAALSQINLPYMEAARTLGVGPVRSIFVHLLPNVMPTVVASVLIDFVYAIVSLSSLSFLGLGVPAGSPDWGRMISENRPLLELNAAAVLGPALAIMLLATAFTIVGDSLYDRLRNSGDSRESS